MFKDNWDIMTDNQPAPPSGDVNPAKGKPASAPLTWESDLRTLYHSVVTEPLPASFDDLLARLDALDE